MRQVPERTHTIRNRTWRLPLGEGLVSCPTEGPCGVERCLPCTDFVGYVDGAVICHRSRPQRSRRLGPTPQPS